MQVEIDSVDLKQMPERCTIEHNLTILGDLHGCALKLLYFLIQEVATISKQDYQQYLEHYLKSECFDPKSLKLTDREKKLILLGDDLADRGANDALTLGLFAWMHEQQLDFSVIFSNHALFFLEIADRLERILDAGEWDPQLAELQQEVLKHMDMGTGQAQSLLNFLNSPKAVIEQAVSQFKRQYLQHLKLFDYCIDPNGNVVLFSHAPIHLPVIEMLAKGFKVWPKQVRSIRNLTRFNFECLLHELNQAFQAQFASIDYSELNAMIGHVDIKHLKLRALNKLKYGGLALISWNRTYDGLLQDVKLHQLKDATVSYVHGHDKADFSKLPVSEAEEKVYFDHYISLDNRLGKGMHAATFSGENPIIRLQDNAVHYLNMPKLLVKMS